MYSHFVAFSLDSLLRGLSEYVRRHGNQLLRAFCIDRHRTAVLVQLLFFFAPPLLLCA